MDNKVPYWVEISDYDLDTAEAMLASKRYLYVGFMCHQTIEKILKHTLQVVNQKPHLIPPVYLIWQRLATFTSHSLKIRKISSTKLNL
jgi:HEPN domain-containing protein